MKRLEISALALALFAAAGNANALGSLTDITIYDRAEHRSLPVYEHDGRYYVVGRPGNEYQIQVRNQTGADVLTVVSVDGVNVVSGETAHWNQTGYVLDAWSGMDIKGWRKNMERTAAFFFTRLPDSYAARTGRPDNVGVIGVAVYQRKLEPVPYPVPYELDDQARATTQPPASAAAPEPSARADASAEAESKTLSRQNRDEAGALAREKRLGTGHGRSETSYARYTSFERASDTPAEIITLYYDSYRNLVAQGVIPHEPVAVSPDPFPSQFVPDPPRR